jgi:hypothetical protein
VQQSRDRVLSYSQEPFYRVVPLFACSSSVTRALMPLSSRRLCAVEGATPNHGCDGAVCSPATSAPSASRLAAEAPFITKISMALPGVEPRFLKL